VAALAVGGVGAVGIVVGAVAGALAASNRSDLKSQCAAGGGSYPSNCGGGTLADDRRTALASEARSMVAKSTASTIAFVAGGVCAAGGVLLWVTAPRGNAPVVGLRVSPGAAAAEIPW
jgi:hypothetical protein